MEESLDPALKERARSILKYLRNELSEAERLELEAWLAADEENRRFLEEIADEHTMREQLELFKKIPVADDWERFMARAARESPMREARVVPLHREKRRWWLAVAAAVVILAGSAILYRLSQAGADAPEVAGVPEEKKEVVPGGNKAELILADGSRIVLEGAEDGQLARQGGTRVVKSGSRLAYQPATGKEGTAVLYNTVSTPRGGQYQVALPDGSQVWLNAASSVHFPTEFKGKERRVEISGEAYFEVAKNAAAPFVVRAAGAEVKVLGTHFNVMAYGEEAVLETTLLEGAVQFASGKNARLLQPGQQARLSKSGEIKIRKDVDVEDVVAWKDGRFSFDNADIETVMNQLSRWYDVEVVYQSKDISDRFVGVVSRSSPLSEVLKVLELTSTVHFKVEGRKIIVMP